MCVPASMLILTPTSTPVSTLILTPVSTLMSMPKFEIGIEVDAKAGVDAAADVVTIIKVFAAVDVDVDVVTYACVNLDV